MSSAYSPIGQDLAARIKKARGRIFTQKELASRLGVSERTLQNWEMGTSFPQPRHHRAILAFLNEQEGVAA